MNDPVQRLVDREAELRVLARQLELVPAKRRTAERLIARANLVRVERLAVLHGRGLI